MEAFRRWTTWAAILVSALALITLAVVHLYAMIDGPVTAKSAGVDYTVFITILLTTVTIVFSFGAILLAVIGVVGFKNLKSDAAKFAASKTDAEIRKAFQADGYAIKLIQSEFQRDDAHLKEWMQSRIRIEVIELFPLIRADLEKSLKSGLVIGAATDEGEVE